jgi:hypothetical protein
MSSESDILLNSSNIQNILITLVLVCAIVYAFIEFKKIYTRLDSFENNLKNVNNTLMSIVENRPIKTDSPSSLPSDVSKQESPVKDVELQEIKTEETIEPDSEEDVLTEEIKDEDILIEKVESQNKTIKQEVTCPLDDIVIEKIEATTNEMNNDEEETIIDIEDDEGDDGEDEGDDEEDELNIGSIESFIQKLDSDISQDSIELLNNKTIKELKNILESKDLPTSGNKQKLIKRILDNNSIDIQ